jgi:hypothetical protein
MGECGSEVALLLGARRTRLRLVSNSLGTQFGVGKRLYSGMFVAFSIVRGNRQETRVPI